MAVQGISGLSVVVTGAGRGMGRGVALAFAQEGAKVAVIDLVEDRVASTVAEIEKAGGTALGVKCDITKEPEVAAMARKVVDSFGKVDVLCNIAGAYTRPFPVTHETPESDWDLVMDSNLKGTFLCAKHVIPSMLRSGGGRIINFASNAGRTSSPVLGVAYTAAKTGVVGLTRHLAKEYAKNNILVNTLAPGPAKGERGKDILSAEVEAMLTADIPLGRMAENEDIAPVVLFLASPASRYITGATIDVNGGYVMV